jgi:hypothetical protein
MAQLRCKTTLIVAVYCKCFRAGRNVWMHQRKVCIVAVIHSRRLYRPTIMPGISYLSLMTYLSEFPGERLSVSGIGTRQEEYQAFPKVYL